MLSSVPYVAGVRHAVLAIAATGIVMGAAACSANGTPHSSQHHGARDHGTQHHGARDHGTQDDGTQDHGTQDHSATGTWDVQSCQVDVTYADQASTVDYYVPDTGENFRLHYASKNAAGDPSLAVVITFVNHTGSKASLPTGLVVSFTDQSGRNVGSPQPFNRADGTGYGGAVANGRGSGEVFSSGTLFNAGQAVAESPDVAAVPPRPGLTCNVTHP